MRVIIVGCGKVGSAIAHDLLERKFDVVVIDRDPDTLLRLGAAFDDRFYKGEALNTELLEQVGAEEADSFIACTDDDDTNIVIAQIAQRRYRIPNVVVRIYDPQKGDWYEQKGLRIVCPTGRAVRDMIAAVDEAANAQSGAGRGLADAVDNGSTDLADDDAEARPVSAAQET